MRTTSSLALAVSLTLAMQATSSAADWDQVFKATRTQQVEPQVQAAPPPQPVAQPAGAARATPNPAMRAGQVRAESRPQQAAAAAAPVRPRATGATTEMRDIARGQELYRQGQIAQAAQIFEAQALAAGTPAEQSSTLFRVGVQWQGDLAKVAAHQRLQIQDAAISAYRKTLEIKPDSGPALNNLAQLLKSNPANTADADALLVRAIALNDSRKGVYLLNRATLKRDSGDLKGATELALQAATDDRNNIPAHDLTLGLLTKREDSGELLKYIRSLASRGLVVRALDSAVAGMNGMPGARKALLVSMANSLASEAYTADPREFEKTDAGLAISRYSRDESIGAGVEELLRVLRSPEPVTYLKWWNDGYIEHSDPRDNSPAEGMKNLTRRCAEIYHANGEKGAEQYYLASVILGGKESSDPRALLGLSEMLYEQKRMAELDKLLEDYIPGIMEAKGRSLAASDYYHTYQLRLALGMMYGYRKHWVSTAPPYYAASIWMLEHATESANRYNDDARLPVSEQVKLPPNAVKMLSLGYANTDRLARSIAVRLDFAEQYLGGGQREYAQLVLDPAWQRTLPPDFDAALKQRLADLTTRAGS